jgi:hypothetical protein
MECAQIKDTNNTCMAAERIQASGRSLILVGNTCIGWLIIDKIKHFQARDVRLQHISMCILIFWLWTGGVIASTVATEQCNYYNCVFKVELCLKHLMNQPQELLLSLLWLCRLLLGSWPIFQFFDPMHRTPWTRDQPIARPLPTRRTTQT